MRHLLLLTLSLSVLLPLGAASAPTDGAAAPVPQLSQDDPRPGLEHYNVSKKGLALDGYDPVAYFPDHGAKASDKVDIDPQSFLVEGGKLPLFYDGFFGDTRKSWSKAGGATKLAAKGVENWARISAPKK